jgi:polyferredoxin
LRLPSYYLMPWSSEDAKIIQWAFATCFVLVPILLLTVVFNRKALDKIEVTDKQINRGRKILPIYILVSLIVLVTLLIWHGSQEGNVIVR